MKKNKLVVLVGLAVASFLLLTGFRHAGGLPHGAFLDKKIERALDEIEATEEQRAQILAIKERVVASMQARKGERQAMKQEMLSFWTEENPDPAKVHAKVDERLDARRAAAHEMADAMIEVHRILTPEQRAELAQLIEKRHEKRGKRHGYVKEGAPAQE